MPYLEVSHKRPKGTKSRPVNLFYELYGAGDTKCLLIMGLAGTHSAWAYQLKELAGTDVPNAPNVHTSSGNDITLSATEQLEAEEQAKAEKHRDSKVHATQEVEAVMEELEGLEVDDSDESQGDSGRRGEGLSASGSSLSMDDVSKSGVGSSAEDNEDGGAKHAGTSQDAGLGANAFGAGRMCCAYDNRGVGRSTILKRKSDYNTTIMAEDALALMDHLGWEKAHVFGHSMGGMIACKLAAMAPHRVKSLALISVTGGGFECIPAMNKTMVNISYRFLKAKDPASRADVDLDCHFTPEYLEETIEGGRRRDVLYKEYVHAISAAGLQPKHGLKGHENACWTHRVDDKEIEAIRAGGFLISIIHGRGDIVASVHHANKLTQRLNPIARLVVMPGGHLVLRESAEEVNKALTTLITAAALRIPGAQWGAVLHSQSSDNLTTLATAPAPQDEPFVPGRGMRLRNYLNTFQDTASRKLLSIQRTSSGNVLTNLKLDNVELQRTSSGAHEKLVLQT